MIAACPGNHFCGCKPSTFASTPLPVPRLGSLSLAETREFADLLARHLAEDPEHEDISAQLLLERLYDSIDAGLDCR